MNLIHMLTNENPVIIGFIKVILTFPEVYLFYKLFSCLLKSKSSKKEILFYIVAMTLSTAINTFCVHSLFNDIISIFAFVLSVKFILKYTIKNTVIAIVVSYLSALVAEFIVDAFIIYVLHLSIENVYPIPIYYFIAMLCEIFFILLFYVFLSKLKDLHLKVKISFTASTVINFILGILTMILETYLFSTHMDVLPLSLSIIIILSSVLYFVITMITLLRTNRLEKTQEELENEKIYNKTLSLLHDNIRGFKHDFNNIVQAIGGYIAMNDLTGLNNYYEKLLADCKISNNLNLLNPESINNPSIYSLLTNKYFLATEKGITMNFSIFSNLSCINSNMYELSRILGILLDNAVEAAEETEEKLINIEIKSDDKKHIFIIKNSFKDKNISTTKIFEKGYSTKSNNTGLGLWNVHKILSKNTDLDLFTTIEDNMFCQQLAMYHK